ncbi:hypothetical protein [Deinococcus arcticus]|uniref:Uncharacterized protein n=1 Tax=Deinococcus arcticus TaxID=2136176 RepID=A0A2T3W4V1_9DEIO|nr:hypothetical protein [Deinococcus arcticus]PTA66902.1 hypothetical protein C8263_15735 [Deinococcus arcticus]
MTYSLLQPTPDGVQTVARFGTYVKARAAANEGHEYTATEMHPSGYVEVEDKHGQTLYLITWTKDEESY